jgi:hypothetical protein
MRSRDFQFIIDEILQEANGGAIEAAKHQYGCRIMQRLFEFSSPTQLHAIVEELLAQAVPLSQHMYATFVLQHLLQHGADCHVSTLAQCLTRNVTAMGMDPYSAQVLELALTHAPQQDQLLLASVLVAQHDLLSSLSDWRHGYHAARIALQKVSPSQRKPALLKLQQRKEKLRRSRYGKKLALCVERMSQEKQCDQEEREVACYDNDP